MIFFFSESVRTIVFVFINKYEDNSPKTLKNKF